MAWRGPPEAESMQVANPFLNKQTIPPPNTKKQEEKKPSCFAKVTFDLNLGRTKGMHIRVYSGFRV